MARWQLRFPDGRRLHRRASRTRAFISEGQADLESCSFRDAAGGLHGSQAALPRAGPKVGRQTARLGD
jgi:hypothetical protein